MGRRAQRLGTQLVREISLLLQNEVKDPRLGFVTVHRVDLTDDISLAKVFVSLMGDEAEQNSTMIALRQSASFIRKRLGRMLKIRSVPVIEFHVDKNLDHADRINEILSKLDDPELPDEN